MGGSRSFSKILELLALSLSSSLLTAALLGYSQFHYYRARIKPAAAAAGSVLLRLTENKNSFSLPWAELVIAGTKLSL